MSGFFISIAYCVSVSTQRDLEKRRADRKLVAESRVLDTYERETIIADDMDRRRIAAKRQQKLMCVIRAGVADDSLCCWCRCCCSGLLFLIFVGLVSSLPLMCVPGSWQRTDRPYGIWYE